MLLGRKGRLYCGCWKPGTEAPVFEDNWRKLTILTNWLGLCVASRLQYLKFCVVQADVLRIIPWWESPWDGFLLSWENHNPGFCQVCGPRVPDPFRKWWSQECKGNLIGVKKQNQCTEDSRGNLNTGVVRLVQLCPNPFSPGVTWPKMSKQEIQTQ